jgi:nucleoside-diphosphate-sugar epimerase
MSATKILVTGGGGFIGYHLTLRLAARADDEIVLVDNFGRGRMDDAFGALCERPNVRLITGDLREAATRKELGTGYDEVYHLAALLGVANVLQRPVDVLRVNALLTAEILEWFVAGGGAKLLFSSTSEVYAWTQHFHPLPIPTPEDVPLALTDLANPRSTYAGSKLFGELCATQYCSAAGKPFVIVRYHNVYGPRMGYDHVIPQLHERAAGGESPLAVYSADHMRAFCFIDDAVNATILAMRSDSGRNQTFNVGNDSEEVTIAELARRVLVTSNIDATLDPRPAANDPIGRRCPDVSKARRLLGYGPVIGLDEGLRRTIAWYAEHPKPSDR